jgi:hypothetical protein
MRASLLLAMGLLSFLLGCGRKGGTWERKDGTWYYKDVRVAETDGKGFESLDDHYARDSRQVYYGDSYRDGREYYLIRHDRVVVIANADPASFRLMPGPGGERGYARDARLAWFEGKVFPVKDLASLQILDYSFARDKVTGYYMRQPVAGSDGGTFESIDSHYARDRTTVFYCDIPYDRAESLPPIPQMTPLPGADPASFRLLEEGYAADARQVYWNEKVVGKDPASFTVLTHNYAKTPTAIVYRGEKVKGADLASFTTVEPLSDSADARDKSGEYWMGKKRK